MLHRYDKLFLRTLAQQGVHIKSTIFITTVFVCQMTLAASIQTMNMANVSVETSLSNQYEHSTKFKLEESYFPSEEVSPACSERTQTDNCLNRVYIAAIEEPQERRAKNLSKTAGERKKKQIVRRPPPSGVKVLADLEYARVDGQSLLLDLYMPENETVVPPLIVWIHGGGWVNGDKAQVNRAVVGLSAEGYAVASLNYRMNGLKAHPQQIHDIKGAVRWLRAQGNLFGYDTTRIGIGGGSAGGHLALLLGLSSNDKLLEGDVGGNLDQSSSVQAILNMYGPSDLNELANMSPRFRKTKGSDPALLKSASPLTYLTKDDPPLLIIHGDKDKVVPVSQSQFLHEKYLQTGLDSTIHVIRDAGHGGRAYSDLTRQGQIKDFFDKYIKFNNGQKFNDLSIGEGESSHTELLEAEQNIGTEIRKFKTLKPHGFNWMIGPRAGLTGSEEKFKRLLKEVDQTLSTNTLISGVYLITHWDIIETEEGYYNFERLDRIIEVIRRHDRYYKLAVAPGIYSPDWLYSKGAKPFHTTGSNPMRADIYHMPLKIPLPWDSTYQSSYFSVLEQVAQRYGSDEFFRAIALTVATFMSPEWHLPHSQVDRDKWKTLGALDGKLEVAWKEGIARFAELFPHQYLVIEASSFPIKDEELGDSIIDYGATKYAGRFAVQINQLTGKFDQINSPSFAKLLRYRKKYGTNIIIGMQNLKGWSYPKMSKLQGSKEMTAFNYLQAEAEYWELWYGDGKNRETTELLNNLLKTGKRLGLEKFKDKLTSDNQANSPVK